MSKYKKARTRSSLHPVHFHIGLYIAIAALLVTAMKSSQGMVAALYASQAHMAETNLSHTHMREAETHIGHAQLSLTRSARVSGS